MLGSEWIWKRTLRSQTIEVIQGQLENLQQLREQFPLRRRKYDRMMAAIVDELARRTSDYLLPMEAGGSKMSTGDVAESRNALIGLYEDMLQEQQARFEGRIEDESSERTVRLAALLESKFELYRSRVPGMAVALEDPQHRRNMGQRLTVEYMPLLMLDPDELPSAFAAYMLWKFGSDETANQSDVAYLKDAFRTGLDRLPEESREAAIEGKHEFEWGKLV